MKFTFTTQFTFDPDNSDKHLHSNEKLTIPCESFTVRELLIRSVSNTMPELYNPGGFYDDDIDDFEDSLLFSQVEDLADLKRINDKLSSKIADLEHKSYEQKQKENLAPNPKKPAEPEQLKENLAPIKNDEE